METLKSLGYHADSRVLNALDFGVAQKRERIFIVGFRQPRGFSWPRPQASPPSLDSVLEADEAVPDFYWASPAIRKSRRERRIGRATPRGRTIWHENKGGNVSALPYSCALRAGASYNYLLVDGKRRLTEREMLRLQGFPESFQIACGYSATRKQAGNSVAVPCVFAVVEQVLDSLSRRPVKAPDAVPTSLFALT
jgi:DNA (cytosine-5)-methyltransferase 1